MADAMVERRPPSRFFCHRCLVEFQDVEQEYICPYCEGGFIEQLEADSEGVIAVPRDDYSDADMSNIGDMTVDEMGLDNSDEFNTSNPPRLNDLAFLMSGGRVRTTLPSNTSVNTSTNSTTNTTTSNGTTPAPPVGLRSTDASHMLRRDPNPNPNRSPTLMEELLWMISGGRPPAGAMTAGSPFVLVGTPGDYVLGGEAHSITYSTVKSLRKYNNTAHRDPAPRGRSAYTYPEDPIADSHLGLLEQLQHVRLPCLISDGRGRLGRTDPTIELNGLNKLINVTQLQRQRSTVQPGHGL
ncbi:jg16415 [Pararge aegeria aegeria]|uniref:Jg16415 protein n=1 Tax=Pararge aegeria aegeria TaxID=348720 RepID=A0A8S4SPF6_9NEOP|nr:jg16415 [Pararge aegeria aegeria]